MANVQLSTLGSVIKTAYEGESNTNAYTDTEKTKLAGIEASATADQTGAEIKVAYEGESDTNAYTDAEKTKLAGIEASATADQTGAEIKVAYEGESNTNAYTDAEKTLLDDISKGYKGQNLQTGTSYTMVLGDAGKIVEMNNASANTLTIPANASVAFPVDTRIDIVQYGAGTTTVAITSDTLRGDPVSQGQYKMMSLWKRAATEWVIVGGTTA